MAEPRGQNTAVVQGQTYREDYDPAADGVAQKQGAGIASIQPGLERENHRDADDEKEEGEDEVGRSPAVPLGVFERPVGVVVARIVDPDHGGSRAPAEYIGGGEA